MYIHQNKSSWTWKKKSTIQSLPIWIWMIPQYVQWPTPITYLYLFHAFVLMLYISMTDTCTNVHLLTRNWVYFSFQWKTWSEIFGGSRSGAGSYVVTYFIYMLWAIVFAMLAALFVRVFAPYACGSGIPEVSSPLLKEARWSNNLSSD